MSSAEELTPTAQALLDAVREAEGQATDTEAASQRVFELLRERGRNAMRPNRPPWFGLSDDAHDLERRGLIEVDAGMAQYHQPGTPTPTADRLYLALTEAGRDWSA